MFSYRRTFRKPRYSEAAEEFRDLQLAMKREDCPPYEAFCAMAVARCEQAQQRVSQSAWAFEEAGANPNLSPGAPPSLLTFRAGALFWQSELELADVMGFGQKELVPLAIQCYEAASDVCSFVSLSAW
jgi:hypothetical protein